MLFFFVCRHQGRVSFRNHVPKDFSIVAAFPDLYPSTTEISIPNLWKQYHRPPETRQEENYSLPEYWPFLPIFHCFFFFTLTCCGPEVIGSRVRIWQCYSSFNVCISVEQKSVYCTFSSLPNPMLFKRLHLHKCSDIYAEIALNWYLFGLFGSFPLLVFELKSITLATSET